MTHSGVSWKPPVAPLPERMLLPLGCLITSLSAASFGINAKLPLTVLRRPHVLRYDNNCVQRESCVPCGVCDWSSPYPWRCSQMLQAPSRWVAQGSPHPSPHKRVQTVRNTGVELSAYSLASLCLSFLPHTHRRLNCRFCHLFPANMGWLSWKISLC